MWMRKRSIHNIFEQLSALEYRVGKLESENEKRKAVIDEAKPAKEIENLSGNRQGINEDEVRKILDNRLLGFDSPRYADQMIIEIVNVLANKNISENLARSILGDVEKIISRIAKI